MECKSINPINQRDWCRELIDTLWNVNTIICAICVTDIRINRYIMECKFVFDSHVYKINRELIDTLWNVNSVVIFTCGV